MVEKKRRKSKLYRLVRAVLILQVLLLAVNATLLLFVLHLYFGGANPDSEAIVASSSAELDPSGTDSGETSGTAADEEGEADTTADESAAETEEPSEEERLADEASKLLGSMELQEKIYQLFIVTQEQLTDVSVATESNDWTKTCIQNYPVGGIVYFEDNIQTPEQCTAMISGIQSYSTLGLFIAVDEEGGRVARLGNNSAMGVTSFPSMQEIGAQGAEAAYDVGATIGAEIQSFGFNVDFAPVADVYTNAENTVIGDRAFASDAAVAAEMVSAAVEGFHDSNMICTLKHFPGHGDTAEDSHYGTATTYKTLEQLEEEEFLPFQAGIAAGADMVMVGHISTPNVEKAGEDDSLPATLSYTMITETLRGELGFDGVVLTDSMSMQAITDHYSSAEAAVMALSAGADIILIPSDLEAAANGIMEAVNSGELTEERIDQSLMRILTLKLQYGIIPAATE
ncbi:MAG: glycoside hydrolase family 3 protein [Clostridiales bacterium]|nr:glycoside hydrolase family 3 protein [Clostridiales bacterium]